MTLWKDEEEDILVQITNEVKFAGLQDKSKAILFPTNKVYRQVCSALESQGYFRTVNAIAKHWNIIVRSRMQHQNQPDTPWNAFEQNTLIQMTDGMVVMHSDDPATIPWAKHWRDVSEKLISLGHHRVPMACFAYWYSTYTALSDNNHVKKWRKNRNSKKSTQQAQKRPQSTMEGPLTKLQSWKSRHMFTKEHKALLIQALGPKRTDHLPSQEVIDDLVIKTGHSAKSVKDSLHNHRRYRQPLLKEKEQYVKKNQNSGASDKSYINSSNMHSSAPSLDAYLPMFDMQPSIQYQSQYATLANNQSPAPFTSSHDTSMPNMHSSAPSLNAYLPVFDMQPSIQYQNQYATLANTQSPAPFASSHDTSMPNMHSSIPYNSQYTTLLNIQPLNSYAGSYASMSQQANERMRQESSTSFNNTTLLSNERTHPLSPTGRRYSNHSSNFDYDLPQFSPRTTDYGEHDSISLDGPSRSTNSRFSAAITTGISNRLMASNNDRDTRNFTNFTSLVTLNPGEVDIVLVNFKKVL